MDGFIKPIVSYVDYYEVENTYKLSIFIGTESAHGWKTKRPKIT
jgi:hypothetical protein